MAPYCWAEYLSSLKCPVIKLDSSPMAICARDRKAVMLSSLSSLKIDQHGWSVVTSGVLL